MLVNHLKSVNGQEIYVAQAYGKQIASGTLTKSYRTGSDPTHVVTVQQMLGRGPWDACEALWFNGLEIPAADFKFYPGIGSPGMGDSVQGQDSVFNSDTPHSGFAWLRAELPEGVPQFDTKNNPPIGLTGVFRTTKCQDYDEDGDPAGSIIYSPNPALQVADLIIRLGGRPTSRIDWPAWVEWRDFLGDGIDHNYTIIPDLDGIGLWVAWYTGADFNTFVKAQLTPYPEFTSSSGAPAVGLPVDNFSGRFEGFIKPKYSETYTFSLTHTHGARLWIDDLTTPLIDQWATTGTHNNTKALTADQYYPIKIDWRHTTGAAELRLNWSSTSQTSEVVSHRCLYPKTINRARYETHPFFAAPTRLDDAVRTILSLCNSTVQEVDGKLKFFCFEQLTVPSYSFRDESLLPGTLRVIPRDPLNIRNSWQVKFRDVDTEYIEEPIDPIVIERQDLIETAGRRIDGSLIEIFNVPTHQAYRTLETAVKRACDRQFDIEVSAQADTYKVLPGDAVTFDAEILNISNRPMMCVEAYDDSSEETPEERRFLLADWTGDELDIPDEEAPSVPEIDTFVADSETELTVTWSASTDNIAVDGYEVRIKPTSGSYGSAVDVGDVLTYQFTGLSGDTSYTVQVRAYDAGGNYSDWSDEATATTDEAFTPDLLPDIVRWYKAKLESYANNDPVGVFNDQIGGFNLTASGSNRPTFKTNSGDPYLEFDGVDDYFLNDPIWPAMTDHTICMVFEIVSDVGTYDGFLNSYTWSLFYPNAPGTIRWITSGGKTPQISAPARPTGTLVIYLERNGSNLRLRLNGSEVTDTGDAGTATHQAVFLGRTVGGEYSNIRVKDIIVADDVLDSGEFSLLAGYIGSEYGVTL